MLFPTSFGYFDPHILKVAEKYKDVTFLHCGGMYTEGKHPTNVGSYFGYIDEAQYVSGIVAGLTSKTNKLGFIAAKPIPQVLRNINAFTLGARSVNPKVTTTVVFTGDWSLPVKEAEAANSLIDQGVDVLTAHVDSPKVIVETAERRGIFSSGYHAEPGGARAQGLPDRRRVELGQGLHGLRDEDARRGKTWEHLVRGGLKEGFVKMSPYGAGRVARTPRGKADAAKAKLTARHARDLQGPAEGQHGQGDDRRRHGARRRPTSSSRRWTTWSRASSGRPR